MSICDRCYAPGICCRGFTLQGSDEEGSASCWVSDAVDPREHARRFLERLGLPFEVSSIERRRDAEADMDYWVPRFSCPKLGRDGRCTIYGSRPQVCRDLEPAGGSRLCVHSHGAEGTGEGL